MISIIVPSKVRKVAYRYKDPFFETSKNYNCISTLLCLYLFEMKSLSFEKKNQIILSHFENYKTELTDFPQVSL